MNESNSGQGGVPFDNRQYQQPVYQPPYQQDPYQIPPPYMGNAPATPVIDIMRRHGTSPLMLALVILIGAGLVVSAVALFFNQGIDTYYTLNGETFYYGSQSGLESDLAASRSVMVFFWSIPGVIMWIGVLLFYLDCRNPRTPLVARRGLTIIQVMTIISVSLLGLMMVIIGFVLMVSGPLLMSSLMDYYNYGTAAVTGMVMTILGLVFIVVIAVMALYYISFLKTLSALKQNAVTGVPIKRVSMLFIVMLYIMGGITALGTLGNFDAPLTAISALISASALIIGGIILQRYRSEIDRLVMMSQPPMQ